MCCASSLGAAFVKGVFRITTIDREAVFLCPLAGGQISIWHAILRSMDNQIASEVQSVDRSWNGVLVIFSDGQSAIYPPELLLRLLPQALPVSDLQGDGNDLTDDPD